MSPKFRGGSDDWMDDEGDSSARTGGMRGKKKPASRASSLSPEEANATVAEVFPKLCRVRLDSEAVDILCSYRRAGVVGGQGDAETRERTPVAVGDRVKANRTSPDSGVVEGVCERSNRLMRPAPGRDGQQHVLAANVDRVAVVASARSPAFSPGLVDRFLVAAQAAGAEPILCVTKIDLLAADTERPWQVYSELGWSVYEICARTGLGVASLRDSLVDRAVVFCGSSGVGKTSLLRVLLESNVGRVAEVSGATGKGKHTTTSAVLLRGPGHSRWIDTPGVREFGLAEIEPSALKDFFPELKALQCPQSSCEHAGEKGCRAEGLVRHPSYLRILESLRSGEG
jgi:ribosome biogenesis GTPase / thiamine phosphate phosphatase